MSSHRAGKKIAPSHSTVMPTAGKVVDMAIKLPEITKISPGIIRPGVNNPRSGVRVKIANMTGGILLIVRGISSIQEIRIYSNNIEKTKTDLARAIKITGITVTYK